MPSREGKIDAAVRRAFELLMPAGGSLSDHAQIILDFHRRNEDDWWVGLYTEILKAWREMRAA